MIFWHNCSCIKWKLYASESAADMDHLHRNHSYWKIYLNFPCSLKINWIDWKICARLFCGLALCAHSAYGAKRDGDVTWMLDRVGERALIRLFCLGVHSPAHYQAYCPSHCYPYLDVSLFCNFPHLTDTTASPSTPIPTSFSFLSLCATLFSRSAWHSRFLLSLSALFCRQYWKKRISVS